MGSLLNEMIFTAAISLAAAPAVIAADKMPEAYYQTLWCEGKGKVEYVLEDRTRVDCLTETHAVEVDFAHKWAEAIGQALYYSKMTGKAPAVLLIVGDRDEKYLDRFHNASDGLGIMLHTIEEERAK